MEEFSSEKLLTEVGKCLRLERNSTRYVSGFLWHRGCVGASSLGLPGDTPVSVRHQASVEHIFESKKQLVLTFLDQKIGPELRRMVKVRPLVKLGKVAEEIIATAKEEQCDLIVMTSHEGRLRRLFGGAVTERIIRHAPCPVLSMQPSARVRTEKDERLEVKLIDRWAA
jgi:nucleotide-binding universal stress UspA family protein